MKVPTVNTFPDTVLFFTCAVAPLEICIPFCAIVIDGPKPCTMLFSTSPLEPVLLIVMPFFW